MGVEDFSGPSMFRPWKELDRIALRVHTFEALKIDNEGDWRFMAESAEGVFDPSAVAQRRGKSNNDILDCLGGIDPHDPPVCEQPN